MSLWRICGETLSPGEKRQTILRVPMDGLPHRGVIGKAPNGDYEIPATLVCGARPGKTVLISASIHSGEYVGLAGVIRAAREIDPENLTGNVLFLHCVNTSGVLTHHYRTVPEDETNLNQGFPGRADGTVGERIEAWLVREIFPQVDFILDLHGGSPEEDMTPLVFYPRAERVRGASLAAARALSVRFLLESTATRGLYSYAANALDVPGILLERGNGVFCTGEEIEADRRDIRLLLDHLGMCPAESGDRAGITPPRVFRRTVYLESEIQGLWYPAVEKDTDVEKGQLLGVTEDYFGNILREYRAEDDGHVMYYTRGLSVEPGDALVTYSLLKSEDTE